MSQNLCPIISAFEISGAGVPGVLALTAVPAILNLTVTDFPSTDFALAAGVVTYLGTTPKSYAISFKGTGQGTTGTRSTSRFSIFINNAELIRSRATTYNRTNNTDGAGSASGEVLVNLVPGDTIDLRAREGVAADTVSAVLTESNLVIKGL